MFALFCLLYDLGLVFLDVVSLFNGFIVWVVSKSTVVDTIEGSYVGV